MKIGILTDSTCDLPEDILNKHQIEIIPLMVRIGDRQYKDKADITSERFFKIVKKQDVMPTTSQPSAGEFEKIYNKMAKSYDHILSIHLSSYLSGTIQSAKLALKNNPEYNVTVIDSKSASMGLGFLVILAAKLVERSIEVNKIIDILNKAKQDIEIYLTVKDLSYFEKGGRINKASSLIGNLINLKPILKLDSDSTEVEPVDKIRGKNNIHDKLLKYIDDYIKNEDSVTGLYWFGFLYGEKKYAVEFIDKFKQKIQNTNLRYTYYENLVGPVIGSHTGPSAYGFILFKGGKYLDE